MAGMTVDFVTRRKYSLRSNEESSRQKALAADKQKAAEGKEVAGEDKEVAAESVDVAGEDKQAAVGDK